MEPRYNSPAQAKAIVPTKDRSRTFLFAPALQHCRSVVAGLRQATSNSYEHAAQRQKPPRNETASVTVLRCGDCAHEFGHVYDGKFGTVTSAR